MAKVSITDVIEPALFAKYVIERTTTKWELFTSGVIAPDPRINALAGSGGRTVNLPFWQAISGSSEVLSDSGSLTPAKIGATKDVATIHYRGKAFSVNDLAGAVAGDDPMQAIANQVSDFWNLDLQAILNATLKGIFATALASTHANNIAIEDGNAATDANKFSDSAFLDTVFKLGDEQSAFAAMVVHSVIHKRMLDLDLIDFVTPSGAPASVPTYRGRRVIVDDNVLKVAGGTSGYKYYSFVFAPGSVAFGEVPHKNPIDTDRDILAGDDFMATRRHFIMHPRGVKWTGSPAGDAPDNTELATGSNWSKVYADKNIRIAALISNG